MTTIDINKAYHTRDGRHVYGLVEMPNLKVIHGLIEAAGDTLIGVAWDYQGRFNSAFPHKDSNLDLIADID